MDQAGLRLKRSLGLLVLGFKVCNAVPALFLILFQSLITMLLLSLSPILQPSVYGVDFMNDSDI